MGAPITDIYTRANPRRIWNPVQKDAATFVQTAQESGGSRTVLDLEIAPGGGNMLHYHTTFAEHFTVMSGEFGVQIGQEKFTLQPCESAVVPPMMLHRWYNIAQNTAMVRVEILPGSTGFESTLQISYGLARDDLVNKQGLPKNIIHLASLIEMSDTIVPGFFARILPIMRLIGNYARCKGIEQHLIERYCF
jgi:quercetin dioxygenase-like cupin family protein